MAAEINKETTKDYLQVEFENNHPLLQLADFDNDTEAYRQYLLKECESLRKQEYIYASERVCLEYYDTGMDNNGNKKGKDNQTFSKERLVSQNYYTEIQKENEDSKKRSLILPDKKCEPATKCAPDTAKKCGAVGLACCAVTASSREIGILNALDIPSTDLNPQAGASFNYQSLPEEYQYVPSYMKGNLSKENCKIEGKPKHQASYFIKNGNLNAGDQIAIPSKHAASGSHSMTIASIERDADGKPIGFTVQGNNRSSLEYYPITEGKETGPYINNIGQFGKYIDDKLAMENTARENMSLQELEQERDALINRNFDEIRMTNEVLPEAYQHARKSKNKNTINYCENLQNRFNKLEQNYIQQYQSVNEENTCKLLQSQLLNRVNAQPAPEIEINVQEEKKKNFFQRTFDNTKNLLKDQFEKGKQKATDFIARIKGKKKETEITTPQTEAEVTQVMQSQIEQRVEQVTPSEGTIQVTPAQNGQEELTATNEIETGLIRAATTIALSTLETAANEQQPVQNEQAPAQPEANIVNMNDLNEGVESFSYTPDQQPAAPALAQETPAKETVTINTAEANSIDVNNLSGRQQHDMKMLFLRDPAEANKILGNKSWMNSKKLQEAWDKGEISDEQKQALVEFAGKRFDEKGNFADVDGYKAAAEMESDAKGYSRRTVPTDKGKQPQPEEKVSTADLIALQMRNMRGGRA